MQCTKCHDQFERQPFTIHGNPNHCDGCILQAQSVYAALRLPSNYYTQRLRENGVPTRFLYLQSSDMLGQAQSWVAQAMKENRPLFITGACETGKTLALCCYATALVRRWTPFVFISCSQFASHLKAHLSSEERWRKLLTTTRHLFVDDIGAEHDKSGFWTNWLYTILNHRYENNLPTSASSNDAGNIEPRIWRRLTEFALLKEITRVS